VDYTGAQEDTVFPFKRLIVRRKREVLTDGLQTPLDCADAGSELSPAQWHAALGDGEGNREGNRDPGQSAGKPIVLDCRNSYESDVGSFQGALPLQTEVFSQSWAALDELLKDTPKDAPILTHCTGGIRCVKVNAYLQQRLGSMTRCRSPHGGRAQLL
jgi:predicted sulfurtransferase